MPFTKKQIELLQSKAKIRGYIITPIGNIPVAKKPSKQKEWMESNLQHWCNERSVSLEREFKFCPDRKWRFDWAIPSMKIGIEYEGLMSAKSRHTTIKGFTGDTEKYNTGQQLGWKVLRFTALNYKDLITTLNMMK